ncbi:MAG: restriction endonuclease, partial [Dehalococcoidia bacterium]|nr:restriction endonuclease [Dehalococcoidia bacterium]
GGGRDSMNQASIKPGAVQGVGVAVVRDLYGTVMNDGATKGILVTTADYGPDSYDFAKDKPLTLLNGSNLLSLLEKHGHEARIDLQEARAIQQAESEPGS